MLQHNITKMREHTTLQLIHSSGDVFNIKENCGLCYTKQIFAVLETSQRSTDASATIYPTPEDTEERSDDPSTGTNSEHGPHPETGPTRGAKKQQPYIFNRRVGSHGGYFVHFFALFKMLCGGCTTTHPPGVHCSQRVEPNKNAFFSLKLLFMHKNIYINCKILFVILHKGFFK